MADPQHLAKLSEGVEVWNQWRLGHLDIRPNLQAANLEGADLEGANLATANLTVAKLKYANLRGADLEDAILGRADLENADLESANLRGADLESANLEGAYLRGADLRNANLTVAKLRNANLRGADLQSADFEGADLEDAKLEGANLTRAFLTRTEFAGVVCNEVRLASTLMLDIDLSAFVNCQVEHTAPSTVDYRSIARSLRCSELQSFLVATGMPLVVALLAIDSVRSLDPNGLFNLMHTTFISYGGPDEPFASKLQKALQENGVTTFLFVKDAIPGQSLSHVMRAGIREHERVILVCSESSLNRPGVLNEIEITLRREAREGGAMLLIPIAIDRYVFDQWHPDNADLKDAVLERVIADFVGVDTDQRKFDEGMGRLLGALKVSQ